MNIDLVELSLSSRGLATKSYSASYPAPMNFNLLPQTKARE